MTKMDWSKTPFKSAADWIDFSNQVCDELRILDVDMIALHWTQEFLAVQIAKISMGLKILKPETTPKDAAAIIYQTMVDAHVDKQSSIEQVKDTDGKVH